MTSIKFADNTSDRPLRNLAEGELFEFNDCVGVRVNVEDGRGTAIYGVLLIDKDATDIMMPMSLYIDDGTCPVRPLASISIEEQ